MFLTIHLYNGTNASRCNHRQRLQGSRYLRPIQPPLPRSRRCVPSGESNNGFAAQYACRFPAMIEDWRKRWSGASRTDAQFPFLFVQISPYGNGERVLPLAMIVPQ